jgi:hypothetical protein
MGWCERALRNAQIQILCILLGSLTPSIEFLCPKCKYEAHVLDFALIRIHFDSFYLQW